LHLAWSHCTIKTSKGKEILIGVISIETDDLLGGGIGPKWATAIEKLRKNFDFGRWKNLMEASQEYGGRTIKQLQDYGFQVSMGRYLKGKAKAIPLGRGRASQLESPANPQGVTGMRGLVGSLSWASREGMPQGAGEASLLASCFPSRRSKT
jgi:hypothetical protein